MVVTTPSAIPSGRVRVSFEGSLWIGKRKGGDQHCREQVSRIKRILENQGRDVATNNEARQILTLKCTDSGDF